MDEDPPRFYHAPLNGPHPDMHSVMRHTAILCKHANLDALLITRAYPYKKTTVRYLAYIDVGTFAAAMICSRSISDVITNETVVKV